MATSTDTIQLAKPNDGFTFERTLQVWAGRVAMFFLGVALPVALQVFTPLVPTVDTLATLRVVVFAAFLVSFILWSRRRAVDDLVSRIGERTDRNRNATEAVRHGQDELRLAVLTIAASCSNNTAALNELRDATVAAGTRVGARLLEVDERATALEVELAQMRKDEVVDNVRTIARRLTE